MKFTFFSVFALLTVCASVGAEEVYNPIFTDNEYADIVIIDDDFDAFSEVSMIEDDYPETIFIEDDGILIDCSVIEDDCIVYE
ncbi:hypothetical protein [Photobacterium sanguinicancri]|uniref:hypothetical protein n=1 Tax=Photobacterium sanguinicancri TaxID=875932 RepID=UPI0026E3D6CB|nr:hypothetical protein [Photobacterium sanguinicancri]MDO6498690.1 hypothetical protein [Photobacterium sanguinicancri]